MGIGSSNMHSAPRPRRRSIGRGHRSHGGHKHRRADPFRKLSPQISPQNVMPIRQHYQYPYSSYPYVQPVPAYVPMSQPPPYSGYMPMYYNNYRAPAYAYARQPVMMPQQAPYSQPMPAPRQIPVSMYPPYVPSSYPPAYSAGVPSSGPYAPAPVQSVYNVFSPSSLSPGFASPNYPSSAPYPMTTRLLSTDWTGGGKISPGFLGPPI